MAILRPMSILLAIRHAESTMNAEGLWQGQADPPLSENGRAQAQALAREIAGHEIGMLVTSDLSRAHMTAEIVGRALGLEPVLDPDLREMDVGAWSARSHAHIQERWPEHYERMQAGDWDVRPGGGETRREVRRRAVVAVQRAHEAASKSGGRLAIVTHMGVLRSLSPGLQLDNAGIAEFELEKILQPLAELSPKREEGPL